MKEWTYLINKDECKKSYDKLTKDDPAMKEQIDSCAEIMKELIQDYWKMKERNGT